MQLCVSLKESRGTSKSLLPTVISKVIIVLLVIGNSMKHLHHLELGQVGEYPPLFLCL